ncbi:MAG: hypothetical protein Q9168_005963 [Polycauliona sp. 1 TL-2023]
MAGLAGEVNPYGTAYAAHTITSKPRCWWRRGPNHLRARPAVICRAAPAISSNQCRELARISTATLRRFMHALDAACGTLFCRSSTESAFKDPPTQVNGANEAAQLLEQLIDDATDLAPYPSTTDNPNSSIVAPDRPNTFWSATTDPQRQALQFALLRDIVDALPELDVIHLLNQMFVIRSLGPLGNVFHRPTFLKLAEKFEGCFLELSSPDAQDYYNIHPSQFNTRLPLHINDNDLCSPSDETNADGSISERPRSEFTEVSYTIYALEIAALVRECVDSFGSLRPTKVQKDAKSSVATRARLHKKYEDFLAGLPSHFKLGSNAGFYATGPLEGAIPIHRWLIHQQMWSLFLRLHCAGLSSHDGQVSCQLLAQNIITTQAQIQSHCRICGTLSTNKEQVFKAAALLLVDLLFSPNHTDGVLPGVQLNRLMVRGKIEEAMGLLDMPDLPAEAETSSTEHQPKPWEVSARKNRLILKALMSLEEETALNNEFSGASPVESRSHHQAANTGTNNQQSMLQKVKDVLASLQDGVDNTINEMESSTQILLPDPPPSPLAPPVETPDMDVLPTLFDTGPDDDIWQFLNLDPPLSSLNHHDEDYQF